VRWADFAILVPHRYWAQDPAKVLRTLGRVYGDPRAAHGAGRVKLNALRATAPDLLWRHPASRVMDHLLKAAAARVARKVAASGMGRASAALGSVNPACEGGSVDGGDGGDGPPLAALGAGESRRGTKAGGLGVSGFSDLFSPGSLSAVGTDGRCSPHQRVAFNSMNEGSQCV
jgi:hypothetical protein